LTLEMEVLETLAQMEMPARREITEFPALMANATDQTVVVELVARHLVEEMVGLVAMAGVNVPAAELQAARG
jgi:hypothetical protein